MIIVQIVLFLLIGCSSSTALSSYYYVSQSGAGSQDGTSVDNAWAGWRSIDWDTDGNGSDTGVGPGDTLYVIGTIRATTFPISGYGLSETQRLKIASYPDDPGKIWQGKEINDTEWSGPDEYGAYQKEVRMPVTYGKACEWTADPWDNTPLTSMNAPPDESWSSIAGAYHFNKNVSDIVYYKPTSGSPSGKTLTAWASTSKAFAIVDKDFVTIEGLTILNSVRVLDGSDYIIIKNCEISCSGTQTALQIGKYPGYTPANNGIIRGCYIHNAGNGIYFINQGYGNQYNNDGWLVENNYIANISGTRDSHCIGVQGGTGSIFQYNHLYNGGSGLTFWNDTDQIMRDNIVRFNYVKRMVYARGRGIEFSGETADSDLTTGNVIYANVITDCHNFTGNNPGGVGIRIKNGIPTSGYSIKVFNNTVDDCYYNYYILPTNYENYEVGAFVWNNISLNPKSGGYHIFVRVIGKSFDLSIDRNIYYPDGTFKYDGIVCNNKTKWSNASGNDANSFTKNPNLDSKYVPKSGSIAIGQGEVLTLGHDLILDPSSVWPTEITEGNVKTVKQGLSGGGWTIGAFAPAGN